MESSDGSKCFDLNNNMFVHNIGRLNRASLGLWFLRTKFDGNFGLYDGKLIFSYNYFLEFDHIEQSSF